jgi:archaellin
MRTTIIVVAVIIIAVLLAVVYIYMPKPVTEKPPLTGEIIEEEAAGVLEEEMEQALENITMKDIEEALLAQ